MSEIRVLQLGNEDWNEIYEIPKGICLEHIDKFTKPSEKYYDAVFLDRLPKISEIDALYHSTKAYTLFVVGELKLMGRVEELYNCRKGRRIRRSDVQKFLSQELKFFFSKPYGEKYQPEKLAVSRNFKGTVRWTGQYEVVLNGDFGETFEQAAYWRNNVPLFPHRVIDMWLEYKKTPGVEISLVVTRIAAGTISDVIGQREFSEEEIQDVIQIEAGEASEEIFVSLSAKGSGELRIIALHDRYSRGRYGCFLPGGERYVTSEREEIFCYFDPMDRKPPLNVYFSGYKTVEGFEGYYMMQKMGCPFLLIGEPRLEGGCFYMGSEEYEKKLTEILEKYRKELGFSTDEVILSGLSMGTYGALYYGCETKPHALLLGKPLASIGDVAANEQRFRPGGFPTSLDMLHYLCGSTSREAIDKLNDKFWKRFDKADWSRTKFVVSYMIEDDYDSTAYQKILEHIGSEGAEVYGMGYHGRHNDNTGGIVSWFVSQYRKLLREDFGRKI